MALLLSALLYSLSANLDNIIIGIAYGIKNIKIGISKILLISIITSLGTLISMIIGKTISNFLPLSITNILGGLIIIMLGLYFLLQSIINLIKKTKVKKSSINNISEAIEYAKSSDKDNSGDLDCKEACIVAIGLMINNLGTGLAASITGVNIEFTVLFTFILSMFLLLLGHTIGNNVIGKVCGKYAPLLSGLLLIVLGIIECVN